LYLKTDYTGVMFTINLQADTKHYGILNCHYMIKVLSPTDT